MRHRTSFLFAVIALASPLGPALAWDATTAKAPTLEFARLKGVDAERGVYSKTTATVTRLVQEPRTRTVTRIVNGMPVQQEVTYTVQVPIQQEVVRSIDTTTHDAYDGTGERLTPEQVFARVTDGTLVLLAKTPALPKDHIGLLSPKAIVLVPKGARAPK